MYIGKNTKNYKFEWGNFLVKLAKKKLYQVLTIDNKLTYESHIKNICRNAGPRLSAFLTITNYLNSCQKNLYFVE